MCVFIIGQPIAWCISDQETIEVMELFLQSIKKQSPDSSVSVFMTDDGWLHGIKKIIFSLQLNR